MLWLMHAVFAAFALCACSDACIDGTCPPIDLPRRYAGPCESVAESDRAWERCTYRYDEARIAEVACEWFDDEYGEGGKKTTTWTYDAGGQLARVEKVQRDKQAQLAWAWQLDTDPILYYEQFRPPDLELEEVAAYDRARFAFVPTPADEFPHSPLGLIRFASKTFTWSGSGTMLTRVGSDGSVTTFEVDDRGRVVHEHAASYDVRWTFSGDLLGNVVSSAADSEGERTYFYDRHGNLAMKTMSSAFEKRRVYGYDCW